ncbi:hypothetical protein ABZX92_14630 [Lentzea sp. NPDC006480]|uniref:hypothetical protein n=1 Tax=Lentzea sp. NPDC006480 TaxID=3157176 RepID=UPI0033B2C56C
MKKYFSVALATAFAAALAVTGTAGATAPKGDNAVEGFTWTPWKNTYVVGDVVDAKFTVVNHGEVVEQPSLWFGVWADKMLAHSDNFIPFGSGYALKDPLEPGQSVEITIRAELSHPGFQAVNVHVGESLAGEVDTGNNWYVGPITVDES